MLGLTAPRPTIARMLSISLLLLAGLLSAPPVLASENAASPSRSGMLALPGRGPAFLIAVNYEGPADRAWQMWEDGKFDRGLIEADLRRAREAGFTTVRVFVQAALVREVQASNWEKLDAFLAAAQSQGLSVILSLYDYGERDLNKVADAAGRIAARYANSPTILAYDLKNEPHLSDLASAIYPAGTQVPVAGSEAAQTMDDYERMVEAAGTWVAERGYLVTTLDYLDSPEGRQWDPLLARVNASLAAWIQPQLAAIRQADSARPITLSYSDIILAKLPANDALDYLTIHRYPGAGAGSVMGVARLLNNLRSTFTGKPVLLGEFGYSTASVSPEESANYEMALYLQLLSEGLPGGSKWMLNDFPSGFNAKQNAFGAFFPDGNAKPVVAAVRALSDYVSHSASNGGHLYIQDKQPPGYRWAYEADDALILSAANYQGTRVSFRPDGLAQLFLTWTNPEVMRIYSTSPAESGTRSRPGGTRSLDGRPFLPVHLE